jgi:hypothetical protein
VALNGLERTPGVRRTMQKQHWNTCGVSLLDILERDTSGEFDRVDDEPHISFFLLEIRACRLPCTA